MCRNSDDPPCHVHADSATPLQHCVPAKPSHNHQHKTWRAQTQLPTTPHTPTVAVPDGRKTPLLLPEADVTTHKHCCRNARTHRTAKGSSPPSYAGPGHHPQNAPAQTLCWGHTTPQHKPCAGAIARPSTAHSATPRRGSIPEPAPGQMLWVGDFITRSCAGGSGACGPLQANHLHKHIHMTM
jgi:hypothetical protein